MADDHGGNGRSVTEMDHDERLAIVETIQAEHIDRFASHDKAIGRMIAEASDAKLEAKKARAEAAFARQYAECACNKADRILDLMGTRSEGEMPGSGVLGSLQSLSDALIQHTSTPPPRQPSLSDLIGEPLGDNSRVDIVSPELSLKRIRKAETALVQTQDELQRTADRARKHKQLAVGGGIAAVLFAVAAIAQQVPAIIHALASLF